MARALIPRSLMKFPLLRAPMFWDLGQDFSENMEELTQNTGLTVSEDAEHVYIEADIPGMRREDIELSVDNGILWIKGERRQEKEDKERKFYSKASSTYSYRVALPGQLDEKQEPKANYKEGILRITFTKAKKSQSKRIAVQ